ncbi:D-alanyl-D-alanine carboxypeptidase family protein [Selenomonas ruminis]|uniref:serine-type D-Ala-D-Ala carboxypeptidase n=1 Tax=Selenomonas ruminis TaxID=2593411 RepID=A0A5D6W3S0_9FIRM|nr:D-alanyl-D-alanine carboxypeptidase family protein [Selenomonas sp. mPRGC5]TYZ22536.1 D-alanyl-D-alanine carboxypeptidase [Selenomonas sp. mPRGC5]
MKVFRGIMAGILTVCLLAIQLPAAMSQGCDAEPQVTAQAAILIEASTGRVIWEKNADEEHYPASTTKMMTGILGLENIGPRTEVFISPQASGTEDCFLDIHAGERLTAEELITGMLMVSDNGAAVAVAEQVDGSVPTFANRMNAKAKELGMEHTHFENPNGLPNPNHHSTVRDMAKLARYAMENPKFREIVGTKNRTIKWAFPATKQLAVENTNKLLGRYKGMTGIKTGWTSAAGGCLAAAAKRNGVELIVVLMKTPTPDDRFRDAEKILDYGFSHVTMVKGISKERVSRNVWVKNGKEASTTAHLVSDIDYPLINNESPEKYTVTYDIPRVVSAPVKEGEVIGKAVIKYDGKAVGSVDVAAGKVNKGNSIGSWLVSLFEGLLVRL